MTLIFIAFLVIFGDVFTKYIVTHFLPSDYKYVITDNIYLSNVTNASLDFGVLNLNQLQGLAIFAIVILGLLTIGIQRRIITKHYMYRLGMVLYMSGLIASCFDIVMNGGSTGLIGFIFHPRVPHFYLSISVISMGFGTLILSVFRYKILHDTRYRPLSDDEKIRLILKSKNVEHIRVYLSPTLTSDYEENGIAMPEQLM